MNIKSQDIIVVLKLVASRASCWTYSQLSEELGMSTSQVHAAVQRASRSKLLVPANLLDCEGDFLPNTKNLRELLVHGLKYMFVPEIGPETRGIPTGYSAPVLSEHFTVAVNDKVVWPYPQGEQRGCSFSPLHKIAPAASLLDESLYELLALVDAIRGGSARERNVAIQMISDRLLRYEPQ